MADEDNETKQISDKDDNMMEDSTKPEVLDEKKEVKEDIKEEAQTNSEKVEDRSENGDDDEEEDEDDEDEDDKESLPPGLLEQPLEVEGKRQKKKVERLSATMMRPPFERPQLEIEEGSGTKLGDIPYVAHYISATKASDLKSLHRLLFLRVGGLNEIKRNIRKFSGIADAKEPKDREKRLAICNKLSLQELKNICLWLGVKQSGPKAELIERTMSFLEKPEDQGAEIKKKKKVKSKPAAKKGTKRKRKTKKEDKEDKPKKKAKKSKAADGEKEEGEGDEEEEKEMEAEEKEDEESEDDKDADEDDSDYEAPKKKKPKLEVKKKEKKTPKKTMKENGKKEKATPKKAKAPPKEKATPTKAKSPKKETKKKATLKKQEPELSDSLSDDSEDESEEESLAQTLKPPSDDEIKKLVKTILDGADLETVTMKTVVKQVYGKYPKFDLSDRKDFIKSTVREVIS